MSSRWIAKETWRYIEWERTIIPSCWVQQHHLSLKLRFVAPLQVWANWFKHRVEYYLFYLCPRFSQCGHQFHVIISHHFVIFFIILFHSCFFSLLLSPTLSHDDVKLIKSSFLSRLRTHSFTVVVGDNPLEEELFQPWCQDGNRCLLLFALKHWPHLWWVF